LQVTKQTDSEVAGKIERFPGITTGKKDTLSGIIVKEGRSIQIPPNYVVAAIPAQ